MEHLLRDVASTSSAPSSSLLTTQSLSTRVAAQLTALEGLSARLTEIVDYLVAVQQKKLTVNHQIIYHVQEILGLLPQLGGNVDVGQAFRVGGNDSGLVTYLSSMIRTVLALHDLSECRCSAWQEPSADLQSRTGLRMPNRSWRTARRQRRRRRMRRPKRRLRRRRARTRRERRRRRRSNDTL